MPFLYIFTLPLTVDETSISAHEPFKQLDMFSNTEEDLAEKAEEEAKLLREKKIQKAVLKIKKTYGKNAILKGVNFEEGSTMVDRNNQIGGHKS